MRKLAFFLIAVLCPAQTTFVREPRADAVIEVDAGRRAPYKIPRTIYGTFLEPIGKSIYPGLWAQALENPSFEDNLWSARNIRRMVEKEPALERASQIGLPLPWEPLYPAQGHRYEPRWGDAANSYRSLLVMALPGKETGVRQQIWLPVHRVLRYRGSLYAKHTAGPAAGEVSLRRRNKPGEVLARAALKLAGEGWKRYEFELALPAGKAAPLEPLDFAIAFRDDARVLIDQAFLFPSDAVDGMDPDMIAMARDLRTPVVRFGGNFISGYHWRDGVGPMDKRVSMLNQAWGMPEYNHFGTDEFLRFCRLVNAEPQICLNLGSGTPEEAAAWVRYVNERWKGGGLLWELGNELYGNWQVGYTTAQGIAERTRAFAEAVKRVDPKARLIATGAPPDHKEDWDDALAPLKLFDFISTHFIVGTAVKRANALPDFVARASLALPVALERRLREMHARHKRPLAFTEWLFHGPNDAVPRFTNMGGALCTAGFLNALIRVADFTPIADMTGLVEFGGIWKKRGRVYGVPAYWAFRMYSTADAVQPVSVRVAGDAYDVEQGNTRMPVIREVPYLDVVAALNAAGDRLTLFVVNRNMAADVPAQIAIAGFAPRQARVATLKAGDIGQVNDEEKPEAVKPVETVVAAGARWSHTFPRQSVTVVELR